MAGHFLCFKISQTEIDDLLANYANFALSGVQHAAVGWNQASELALAQARNAQAIANRNNLPPHKYLMFPPGAPSPAQTVLLTGMRNGWIREVERYSDPGLGLAALCPAAAGCWSSNDKLGAVIAQIAHGQMSVEIYRIGSKRIE